MAEVTAARVRFRDVKPYDAPASLDELRGPYDGPIDLPHSVRWQADRFDVDVSNLGWRRMAYQALLAEGTRRSAAPLDEPRSAHRGVADSEHGSARARPVGEEVPPASGRRVSRDQEEQRRITRLALEAVGDDAGFALAGSGAIREHGLIDRPTEDVDLFHRPAGPGTVRHVARPDLAALRAAGYTVESRRRQDTFAQLTIVSAQGRSTDMDLGVDWRAHPPVRLEVGPVLSIEDAVGNKVGALFSRAETRDYLDVDAIRRSGRYSDEELLDLVRGVDAGFDLGWFAQNLDNVERIQPEEVRVYGLTAGQLDDVKMRTKAWASSIHARVRRENTRAGLHERIESEMNGVARSAMTMTTRTEAGLWAGSR